jgi:hypothetical protein
VWRHARYIKGFFSSVIVCCAVLGRIGWAERAEVTVGARGCQFSLHLGGGGEGYMSGSVNGQLRNRGFARK